MELSSGFIRAAYSNEDTISFIRKRVTQDPTLKPDAVQDVRHLALFPFPNILEVMAVFHANLTVTGAELKSKLPVCYYCPESTQLKYITSTLICRSIIRPRQSGKPLEVKLD